MKTRILVKNILSLMLLLSLLLSIMPCGFADEAADEIFASGLQLFLGGETEEDSVKGYFLIREAAEAGSADAILYIGYLICGSGLGPAIYEDYTEGNDQEYGIRWLTECAERGYQDAAANAFFEIGRSYLIGNEEVNIDENMIYAIQFFDKASELGMPKAKDLLGTFYTFGAGVAQDPDKALTLFVEAARNGYDDALLNLEEYAYDYYSGAEDLIDINYGTCFKYYEALTEFGNTRAMYNLGQLYLFGLGVSRDQDKAIEWFTKAAEAGDSHAKDMLAQLSQNQK